MDADARLAEILRLVAAYEQSHDHPSAFACCTAHAVADHATWLVGEVRQLAAENRTLEQGLGLNEAA